MLAFSLTACSNGGLASKVKGSGIVTSGKSLPDEGKAVTLSPEKFNAFSYSPVAENGKFTLWYDENNSAVRVTDASGTKVWDSVIDFESLGLKLTNVWKQKVSSMFEINYSHPNDNGRERIVSATLRKLETKVWFEKNDEGIDITYYFPKRKLGFVAEFRLTEGGFTVNIPAESIIENGEYRFVSINMLPFFSAFGAEENGYIMTPYSGGALLDFGKETQGKYMQMPVFSESNITPQESTKLDPQASNQTQAQSSGVSLPIIGMNNTRTGFVVFPDEIGEDTYINISTAYYGIPFNRVSFCYYVRNVSTLSFSGSADTAEGTADILDDDIIPADKKLCYELLGESECDYNGMAQKYREHLIEKGLLDAKKSENADVSVEILMSVPRVDMAGTTLVQTTDFEQALQMVKEMKKSGIENALINLKGWNNNGYGATPTENRVEDAIGGSKGLGALAEYCKEIGYKLILETDYTELNTSFSNLSAKKTAVVDNNGFYITNEGENIYYQRLSVIEGYVNEFIKEFSESGISGINFKGFGSLLYRDYNQKVTYTGDFAKGIKEQISKASKSFSDVAVRGTNFYALSGSDYAYDTEIPYVDSTVYSAYVPLLQLIAGDSVGFISTPINAFFSPTSQSLSQLEYNSIPNFELTSESVYSLQDTHYNTLFSAKFDLWLDSIVQQYELRNGELKEVSNSRLVNHTILAKDVVLLKYENGKELLINKSSKDYTYGETAVKAYRFALVN